jgi:hypothetical protein
VIDPERLCNKVLIGVSGQLGSAGTSAIRVPRVPRCARPRMSRSKNSQRGRTGADPSQPIAYRHRVPSIRTHSHLFLLETWALAEVLNRTRVMMRQTQKTFGTLCMLVVVLAAPAAQGRGSCEQIRAACQSAGFVRGAANLGIGLQVDCIIPIVRGTAQRPRERKPLPQVKPQLIAVCATPSQYWTTESATRGNDLAALWRPPAPTGIIPSE